MQLDAAAAVCRLQLRAICSVRPSIFVDRTGKLDGILEWGVPTVVEIS